MDSKLVTKINKNFRIVFEPKVKNLGAMYTCRRVGLIRFLVKAGQLEKYVGPETAIKAATNAFASKRQLYTLRHRTYGRIDFYSK
jgi:hypothetical protein